MFREMRRADRELDLNEVNMILEKGEYGILSTISESGYPYGVPISYFYNEDKIYFHCAKGVGEKLDNIKANPKVCFTVVGDTDVLPSKFSTKYESVIVFGTASESTKDRQFALEGLVNKYSKGYEKSGMQYIASAMDKTGVYEIKMNHMTGKARK